MALVDRTGKLARFTIRHGNAAENIELLPLLDGVQTDELIADKAYDSNAIRQLLASQGIVATIPPKANRKVLYEYDKESYKTRHRVENIFVDLKQFRDLATRYCKLADSFSALICLARWVLDTRLTSRAGKVRAQAYSGTQLVMNLFSQG
jgi:transposase